MKTLDVQVEERDGEVVVALEGEFDLAGVRDFHRVIMDLAERGPKVVCIDLRKLLFIGATGVRSLLEVEARSRRDGFELVVVKGPPLVQRVFEMTGVDERLSLRDD